MSGVVALVPMKARSVRVKNKNCREIAGKPLFYYILSILQQSSKIAGIFVDTDSKFIKERILSDFNGVHVIDRPKELAGSNVPMNEVIKYDLSQVQGNLFLQTHTTNPMLKSSTVDRAIEYLLSSNNYDSLFSVTKVFKRFYDSQGNPINHDKKILLNTQDLNPLFEENSCIYLFTRKAFEISDNRIGNSPCMFEIDKDEAMDIDDEIDFNMADKILSI